MPRGIPGSGPNAKPKADIRTDWEAQTKQVKTYRALRYQKIGLTQRPPGELVPEAHTWLRVGSHVHMGYLEEVTIPEGAFAEAVQKYCPELAEHLAFLTGVSIAVLQGEVPTNV